MAEDVSHVGRHVALSDGMRTGNVNATREAALSLGYRGLPSLYSIRTTLRMHPRPRG
jgi:hypothetical protein